MAIGTAHHMPPNGPYSDEDTQHYSQQSILWKTFDSKRIRSASEAAAMTSFFQTSRSEMANRLLFMDPITLRYELHAALPSIISPVMYK
jgi:hypothetical protein